MSFIDIAQYVVFWAAVVIFVEAVTEIIVSGEVFFGLRDAISSKSEFLGKLVNCGYCTSIWVSATVAWAVPLPVTGHWFVDIPIKIFVIHRLSNAFHELIYRWLERVPKATAPTTIRIELPEESHEEGD